MYWSFYIKLFIVFMWMVGYGNHVGGSLWSISDTKDNTSFLGFETMLEPADSILIDKPDVEVLREYCPNNYCAFNGTLVNFASKDNVCCLPCDCTDECFERGNCCYDNDYFRLPPVGPRDEGREFCTQTTIINATAFPEDLRMSYMLYQNCKNSENASLLAQCYNGLDGKSISQQLPVHSKRTGRQYRNIYCAMCNEEHDDDITYWNEEFRCSSLNDVLLPFQTGTDPSDVIISTVMSGVNHCVLYFTPPERTRVTRCHHPQDMITSCHYDSHEYSILQDKCTAYHSPVYSRNTMFKNVFCMMCNEQFEPFEHVNHCLDFASYGTAFPSMSILALIRPDETFPLIDDDTVSTYMLYEKICTPPTIYNAEINACIQRKCPLTTLAIGDKCFPPFQRISNIDLDFRVYVTYPFSDQFDPTAVLNQVTTLFTYIPAMSICKSSIKGVYVVGNTMRAHAQVVIRVEKAINLRRTFNTFVDNVDNFNATTTNKYQMEVGKEALLGQLPNTIHLLPFVDEIGSLCSGIAMSEMLFCPLVYSTTFRYLENETVQIEGMIFEPHEYVLNENQHQSVDGVSICLDTYITRYKHVHQQQVEDDLILVSSGSGKHITTWRYMFGSCLLIYVVSMYTIYMEMIDTHM